MTTQNMTEHRAERGFSLLEVIIASVLILMLAYLVAMLTMRGMHAQKYAERMNRVTEITQDVVDEMRRGLTSSVRVFTNDTVGTAYRDLVDLGTLPPALDTSRLATLDNGGILEPDTETVRKTGNELFFARYAWTDEFQTSSGAIFRIDIHRLERFYLTPDGPGPRAGTAQGVNLAHWVSEPLADASQVDAIADAGDRSEVLLHLLTQTPDLHGNVHDQVEIVWLVGEDPAKSVVLRQIDSTGELVDDPVSPRGENWELKPQPELSQSGILYFRHHSVATIYAPRGMGVGRFGWVSEEDDGFPHGLEVQIVGPASARQVLIHLTLISTNNAGQKAHHDMQIISDVRDL